MPVQHFLKRPSGLSRILSNGNTRCPLIRVNGNGLYMSSTISSSAVLQEQLRLGIFSTTNSKSLALPYSAYHVFSATTTHRQNRQNVRLISLRTPMLGEEDAEEGKGEKGMRRRARTRKRTIWGSTRSVRETRPG